MEFGSLLKPKSNMGVGFDFGSGPVKMGSAGIRFYPTTKGKDYTMLFGYGIALHLAPGFYGFEYIYKDYPAFRVGTATNKMQEFSDKPTLFIYTLGTGFSFNRYFTWDMTFIRCLSIFDGQSVQRNSMVNTFVYQVVP